ncbi:hypothetical protein [Dyadobacter sp. SG02]|uniref:hypothetical protein n=1 Tax=Dyadobacter sp. SG02 TaxID=1855291 RepID=UPI00115F8B65|nr:hypothetical protein [Dyadobacter sp. SG02]
MMGTEPFGDDWPFSGAPANEQDDGDTESAKQEKKKPKRHSAKARAAIIKRFNDDYDAIYQAYINPKKTLTSTQLRQLARWKFARQWISEFSPPTDAEVVSALRMEYGISERQAYTDIFNCKRLFASVDKVNEEFEKILSAERIMRIRNKAMLVGGGKNLDVAAKCELILIKLKGWDKEKNQLPEPRNVNVIINSDPATVGALPIPDLDKHIKNFWRKKEEKAKAEIQDVSYEDLLDNPRNERDHQRNQ